MIPRFALPYSAADLLAAASSLFRGRPASSQPFRAIAGGGALFWTASGRQALWLALKALRLAPGAGVAVPLFNDPSVSQAVVEAGYTPVFADVNPETLTMEPDSLAGRRFDAVVAVHLFGQVADVPRIVEAAGAAPVIEDTAHSPLSFLNGQHTGSFGCAQFYSFASTKYWPAGGGGLLVVRDPDAARLVSDEAMRLRRPPALREWKNLALHAAKSLVFSRYLYGAVGMPFRAAAEKQAILEPVLGREAIHRHQAAAACRHAERFTALVEQQRRNSLHLLSLLDAGLGKDDGVVLPVEWPGARYNYHIFPVLVSDGNERDQVRDAMRASGVDTSRIYFNVVERSRAHGYSGGCPVSESIASRLLTLPNYASLRDAEIARVAEAFVRSLRRGRAARGKASPRPVAAADVVTT